MVELLGVLATASSARSSGWPRTPTIAPDLRNKVELAQMATVEWTHFVQLRDRLVELGEDPYEVMESFAATFARFHAKTEPSDWLEGL